MNEVQEAEAFLENNLKLQPYSTVYLGGIVLVIKLLLSFHKRMDHWEEIIKEEWDDNGAR